MPNSSRQNFTLPVTSAEEMGESNFWGSLKDASGARPVLEGGEGQLCVDVAETQEELLVVTPMAGTPPDKLELHLHNDLLTIRGERLSPIPIDAEYFHRETFWGKFSRSIVLPIDVKIEMSSAEYKNGVLTIRLPKLTQNKNIPITVIEDDY